MLLKYVMWYNNLTPIIIVAFVCCLFFYDLIFYDKEKL